MSAGRYSGARLELLVRYTLLATVTVCLASCAGSAEVERGNEGATTICPGCKSADVVTIINGFPIAEWLRLQESGEIPLDGSSNLRDYSVLLCRNCGRLFGPLGNGM